MSSQTLRLLNIANLLAFTRNQDKMFPMAIDTKKLLRNKKVIAEINRHKWLESEIAGYDIGFQAAAEDWMKHHAAAWVKYHMNPKKNKTK